jgi:hypothetical protein
MKNQTVILISAFFRDVVDEWLVLLGFALDFGARKKKQK